MPFEDVGGQPARLVRVLGLPQHLVGRDLGRGCDPGDLAEVATVDDGLDAVVAGGGRGGVAAVTPTIARGDELAVGTVGGGDSGQPRVAEVAGSDDLGAAVAAGELDPGLADAGEGAAVGLGHDDPVAGAVGHELLARRGLQRLAGEGSALGPDAGVQHADDDAAAGLGRATELRPDAVVPGQLQVVDGVPVVGGLTQGVLGDRQDAVGGRQGLGLGRGQLGGEAGQPDLEPGPRLGPHPSGHLVLLATQVRAVALRLGAGDVDPAAGGRSGRREALEITVVRRHRG